MRGSRQTIGTRTNHGNVMHIHRNEVSNEFKPHRHTVSRSATVSPAALTAGHKFSLRTGPPAISIVLCGPLTDCLFFPFSRNRDGSNGSFPRSTSRTSQNLRFLRLIDARSEFVSQSLHIRFDKHAAWIDWKLYDIQPTDGKFDPAHARLAHKRIITLRNKQRYFPGICFGSVRMTCMIVHILKHNSNVCFLNAASKQFREFVQFDGYLFNFSLACPSELFTE